MRISKFLGALAASLMICGAASAATMKLTFDATVDAINTYGSTQAPGWPVGDKIQATLIFDNPVLVYGSATSSSSLYRIGAGTLSNLTRGTSVVIDPGFLNIYNGPNDQFSFGGSVDNSSSGFRLGGRAVSSSLFGSPLISELTQTSLNPSNFVRLDIVLLRGQSPICSGCDWLAKIDSVRLEEVQAVPVPAALPLMALGLVGLGLVGRRRRG